MKKFLTLTAVLLLALSLCACRSDKDSASQAAGPALPNQSSTVATPTAEPTPTPVPLTKEDILEMFKAGITGDVTAIDCVLADGTRGLAGVVLYENPKNGNVMLCFVCEDGYCAPTGLDAPPAPDCLLEYTGDGTVVFQVEDPKTGKIVGYSMRFSRNESGVNFESATLSGK